MRRFENALALLGLRRSDLGRLLLALCRCWLWWSASWRARRR